MIEYFICNKTLQDSFTKNQVYEKVHNAHAPEKFILKNNQGYDHYVNDWGIHFTEKLPETFMGGPGSGYKFVPGRKLTWWRKILNRICNTK